MMVIKRPMTKKTILFPLQNIRGDCLYIKACENTHIYLDTKCQKMCGYASGPHTLLPSLDITP